MKIESRPARKDNWRTEQQDGIFYGSAAVASARAVSDLVVAIYGDDKRRERTYRLLMTAGEAYALKAALERALAEVEAQQRKQAKKQAKKQQGE